MFLIDLAILDGRQVVQLTYQYKKDLARQCHDERRQVSSGLSGTVSASISGRIMQYKICNMYVGSSHQ
jgi:hypothetical protein